MPKANPLEKTRKTLAGLKVKAMKMYEDIQAIEELLSNAAFPEPVAKKPVKKVAEAPKKRGRPAKAK